jgi:Fe-S-cluster-containing dehydrogenase component/formate-dependent nitrite reductase membrane component NrfD
VNYGFLIDNRKCIGCHACTVACKSEHDVPIGVNRTWVKYIEKGSYPNTRRIFSVLRCNHCADAPCVKICPVGALFNREDGIVDFNGERCIACKSCTQACPYDSIHINPETNTAAKCNFCAHRIDLGLRPACVNVCPEQAIIAGDLDNPESEISRLLSRQLVQARKVEKGTIPKLYYINGDAASLNPLAAPPNADYQQVRQAAGVGHFAKYAEKRIADADPKEMARRLAATPGAHMDESPEDYGVTVPVAGDIAKHTKNAWGVVRESARRVHDAPSKGVLWGWEVPAYLWSKAVASGAVLVAMAASLFGLAHVSATTEWVAGIGGLVFLVLTAIFLVMDLDQPKRFVYVILRPQYSSWLTRGGVIMTLFGASLTAYIGSLFLDLDALLTASRWAALLTSLPLGIYTAFLLGQAKGRDFWQSPVLPLHMLIHVVIAGTAFFAIAGSFYPTTYAWADYIQRVSIVGIIVNLMIVAAEMAVPHPTADAKLVVSMILKGRFARLFYVGTLLIGNLIPLTLIATFGVDMMGAAGILILIGIYVTEHIWIKAPQLVPLS